MNPDRFFSLLLALQTRESVTTPDLAEQLDVSVRTVLRDLRWMQDAGFPILVQRGRWGGVTLLPGGALDTARLTPTERDQLALGGLDEEQRGQLGAGTESRRAREKVAVRRPPMGTLLPVSAVVTTDNRPWFGPDTQGADPSALVGDLRRGVRLRVHYRRSQEAAPSWRTVDPYGLLAKGGRWYLVADHSRVPRLYSLERLADWQPTRTPRRLRPETTLAQVAAELTRHWEAGGGVQVHGELAARQLDRAHRILGSRLTVRPRDGAEETESVAVTVTFRELEGVRQLLQFAGYLRVTDPPEARERLRQLARQFVDEHG